MGIQDKPYKRLIFHRGDERKSGKIPIRREMFMDGSDWPSGLAKAATRFFEEVFYVITVPSKDMVREDIESDGVLMKVISREDFKKYNNKCDVFLKRANPEWTPPDKPLTIFYSASASSFPRSKWDVVLTSDTARAKSGVTPWIKGGNHNFWSPADVKKVYDFVVVGRRQKNIALVRAIAKAFPEKSILMIGWATPTEPAFSPLSEKNIQSVGRRGHKYIREMLRKAKWGIICTCNGEGWPMSTQLEYSLCGVPYVYGNRFATDGYYSNEKTSTKFDDSFDFSKWREMSKSAAEYARQYTTCDVSAESLVKIARAALKKIRG